MRTRRIVFVGVASLVVLGAVGCSAPDPGVGPFGPPKTSSSTGGGTDTSGGGTTNTGGTGSTGGTGTGGSTGGGTDAGGGTTGGGTDAGTGAETGGGGGGANQGVFAGGPAFNNQPPTDNAKAKHTAAGQQVVPGKGVACLDCHKMGGGGTPFLMAGTVVNAANGNTGASGVEVKIVDSKGNANSAYTDTDGNFWLNDPGGTTAPFKAGSRNATTVNPMVTSATDGNCNSSNCHGGGQGPVHTP